MWDLNWRTRTWQDLDQQWDLLIIGGGITGTGVFRRAVSLGYKTLLVEANDFSSGTSSRSSKLIHGGFRYLRNRQFDVTKESVREREWLLKEAHDLVTPLGFIMPCPDDPKIASQFALGVIIYDLLAPKWKHRHLSRKKMLRACPMLNPLQVNGGFQYFDAAMDDSRLVLRMLSETAAMGGTAINYCRVTTLLHLKNGAVHGALLRDDSGLNLGEKEVNARVVINATGPWSDELRAQVGAPAKLRKLRGSHLVFAQEKFRLPDAVTLLHPRDHRGMFAIPWEGVTLIGTTDLDHKASIKEGEPFTTQDEIDYILEAAATTFPSAELTRADILSTYAGLRPVINTGIADPSKESRAHVVWEESGMITVTGGKYTTFRIMAEQALDQALPRLPQKENMPQPNRYFNPIPKIESASRVLSSELRYLAGRYGAETAALLDAALPGENQPIANLPNLWSELRWAARIGAVTHLDDLLLRRVRLGQILPDGASVELPRIRSIVQSELGWDDEKWISEVSRYRKIYSSSYSPSPMGFDLDQTSGG